MDGEVNYTKIDRQRMPKEERMPMLQDAFLQAEELPECTQTISKTTLQMMTAQCVKATGGEGLQCCNNEGMLQHLDSN